MSDQQWTPPSTGPANAPDQAGQPAAPPGHPPAPQPGTYGYPPAPGAPQPHPPGPQPAPYGHAPAPQPGPYGYAPYPPLPPQRAIGPRKPVTPAGYPQMLRHATRSWWRPLLSLVILLVSFLVLQFGLTIGLVLIGAMAGTGGLGTWMERTAGDPANPIGFAYTNLALASLIPSAMLAVWLAHRASPRTLFSVTGRFRWGWAATVAAVLFPLVGAFFGAEIALAGASTAEPPRQWVWLLVIALLTTPLQCAGEEFAFRAWLMQSFGSWFGNKWVALLVPIALSVPTFALAHGSLDWVTLASIGIFAFTAAVITWMTGGIEAAVVLHTANNLLVLGNGLLFGGFEESFVSGDTTMSPIALVPALVQHSIAILLVWGLARWRHVRTTGDPEAFRIGARRERLAVRYRMPR